MAVEHAPPGRRGFYGSWPQAGAPLGTLLATGAFFLVSLLPGELADLGRAIHASAL